VYRDGALTTISIFDIVVGDLFQVQTGELLPCDGVVLESNGIECDESAMTGESLLVKKDPVKNPYLLCGCKVGVLDLCCENWCAGAGGIWVDDRDGGGDEQPVRHYQGHHAQVRRGEGGNSAAEEARWHRQVFVLFVCFFKCVLFVVGFVQ
jgi:magnesium-transporting ATPase (P-type)